VTIGAAKAVLKKSTDEKIASFILIVDVDYNEEIEWPDWCEGR
jgi:hypothetical protein